jgi:hypothetical protein
MKPYPHVLGLFVVILLCAAAGARTIYVDDDAPGAHDGTSWTDAYDLFQAALNDARNSEEPVEVRVAQGIYEPSSEVWYPEESEVPTFYIHGGIVVRGGFAGAAAADPNARDTDVYATVLSGDLNGDDLPVLWTYGTTRRGGSIQSRRDNARTVVTISGEGEQVVLDGLVVTGGHCFLNLGTRHNTGEGGALNAHDTDLVLRKCRFEFNLAAVHGGAVYTEGGSLGVHECAFRLNGAAGGISGRGGAIFCNDAEVTLARSEFIANSSVLGGAVACFGGARLELTRCLLAGNVCAGDITAIHVAASDFLLDQCTFAENGWSDRLLGIWEYEGSPATAEITNCIFADEGWRLSKHAGVSVHIAYCNLSQTGLAALSDPLVHGESNITADPLFVRRGYWDANGTPDDPYDDFWVDGDYHLKSQAGRWDAASESWVKDDVTSPCIDAGDPRSPIGHEPFPNGGRINMGAYGGTAEASKSLSSLHGKYGGGTGVPNDPYLIYTAQHLNALGAEPDDWGRHFKLMADIDLAGYWYDRAVIAPDTNDLEPLFQGTPFTGVFDGGGHTISHLSIEGASLSALFGQLGQASWLPDGAGGEVRSLGLIEPTVVVTGEGQSAAALVGCLSRGTVIRCYAEGGLIDAPLGNGVGGLVASNSDTVTGCNTNVKVTGKYHVGGLIGRNSGTVTACHATVTGTGANWVGGLAGSNAGALVQCFSLGRVSGGDHVGGLTGWNDGTITDCYTMAAASGSQWVGGLAGVNVQRSLHPGPGAGSTGQVYHSYSAGPVSGDFQVGGLCGSNGGSIINCFWDVETSGRTKMCGHDDGQEDAGHCDDSFGLPTTEIQTADTFLEAGWDFIGETANGTDDIWWILECRDYPRLWWERGDESPL